MFTLTETTAGFTRSTTVAKDGMAEVCKSAVLTAPATAELEADSIDPPMAPEAMIATTAAEANIRPLPRIGFFELRMDMVFSRNERTWRSMAAPCSKPPEGDVAGALIFLNPEGRAAGVSE